MKFVLQKIKSVGQSFLYLDNFYSLISAADNSVIYLSFVILYGNNLKYTVITA